MLATQPLTFLLPTLLLAPLWGAAPGPEDPPSEGLPADTDAEGLAGPLESAEGHADLPPSEAMTRLLTRLAARHPQHATLLTYGTSHGGRPLQALKVTTLAGEAGGPMVGVLPDLAGPVNKQRLLAVLEGELRALVLDGDESGSVQRAPLQDRLWILDPDPDATDAAVAALRPDPAFDFPAGWDPWRTSVRTGPYPFSTSEAAALGGLLRAERALASLVVLGSDGVGSGGSGSESAPGSLARFAEEELIVRTRLGSGRLSATLAQLDQGRPRLELGEVSSRPLGQGRWLAELSITNPSMDPLAPPAPLPELSLGGARLMAVAWREGPGAFEVCPVERALAGLGAGSRRTLRLVLEASEEGQPTLEVRGDRWRTLRRSLSLEAVRPR